MPLRTLPERHRTALPRDLSPLQHVARFGRDTVDVLALTLRWMGRDKAIIHAGSLAFWTVLSLVPLVIVATSLVVVFGGGAAGQGIVGKISGELAPMMGERLATFAIEAVRRATSEGIGVAGGVALIVAAVLLFLDVEGTFNDIWAVEQRRPLLARVLLFYALITVGPLLVTASLVQTHSVAVAIAQVGFVGALAHSVTPTLYTAASLLVAFKWLPYTAVRWRHAAIAAIVTTVLVETSKFAFNVYVSRVLTARYDQLYGSISLVPIFLTWVFVSWVVVLFGVELSYCLQNAARLKRLPRAGEPHVVASPLLGIELFAPITRAFAAGEGPVDAVRVASESGHEEAVVAHALARLVQRGLVLQSKLDDEVVYFPARPLHDIALADLASAFDREPPHELTAGPVAELGQRVQTERLRALEGLSAADLIDPLSARSSMFVSATPSLSPASRVKKADR